MDPHVSLPVANATALVDEDGNFIAENEDDIIDAMEKFSLEYS